MASFRFSQNLTLPRGVKVFVDVNLKVKAGVARGEVSASDRRSEARARPVPRRDLSKDIEVEKTTAPVQGRKELIEESQPPNNSHEAGWEAGKNLAAWEAGKAPEVEFWRDWLTTKGLGWPWDYPPRFDPEKPLQDRIIRHLSAPPGTTVSILDVGAGPLTRLGKRWKGRTVQITAVDPLADDYNRLLDEFGITALVRTQEGQVERLTERFAANTFDLVNMENALDHSYDPLLGIRQMLEVVKPGGYVVLLHEVNEAHRTDYEAFHQWNFCADNGHFVIWNRETRLSVDDAIGDIAEITVDDNMHERGYVKPILVALKKI